MTKIKTRDKDLGKLLRELERAGFGLTVGGSGHVVIRDQAGNRVAWASRTSVNRRQVAILRSMLLKPGKTPGAPGR